MIEHDLPPTMLLLDAARVAQRSLSWARTQRAIGGLEPAEIGGRQAVTTESLLALLRDRRPPKKSKKPRPELRLVVDNER